MKPKPLPSQELLLELLSYDALTGELTWNTRSEHHNDYKRFNVRYAGKPAFTHQNKYGYRIGSIQGQLYKASRVIWKMIHGVNPVEVDHINGNTSDNRISNLRNVNQKVNTKNKSNYKNNTSGYPGVSWIARLQKYQVTTGGAKNRKYHGVYEDLNEAIQVKQQLEKEYGYHSNHGR